MPKLRNSEKELLLNIPDNAAKLKEAVQAYGIKMSYEDIAKYNKTCLNTAKSWARGLPFNSKLRKKSFWTSDVVYRDLSEQQYAEVG